MVHLMYSSLLRVAVVGTLILSTVPHAVAGEPDATRQTPQVAKLGPPQGVRNPSTHRVTALPPIRALTTVHTGRERLGVTSGTSTSLFPSTPVHRRPDDFKTQTGKLGDGTVVAGPDRVGVTRSASTGMLGTSSFTRPPQVAGRSGLSSLRQFSRSGSGITIVK